MIHNTNRQKIVIICIISVTLLSCLGNKTIKNDIIEHKISYSQRGTRSEALHGDLYVAGEKIPDVFFLVISRDQGFEFFQRYHIWGRDGYMRVKYDPKKEYSLSDQSISREALNKGYYLSDSKLQNTPDSWLFVKWDNGSAFVSPDSLYELIRDLDLRPIPRIAEIKKSIRYPR